MSCLVLVILLNIRIGAFEEGVVLVELVFEQCFAEGLFDFAFAGFGGLPAVEADDFYDLVDVVDDAFDDCGGLIVFEF